MPYFASAQKLTAALLNPLVPLTALKTADESIASSTALQADNELTLALPASAQYTLDVMLFYTASASGELKLGFTFPSGCVVHLAGVGYVLSGSFTIDLTSQLSMTSGTTSLSYEGSGATTSVSLRGTVLNGVTAGNLQLIWAQNTSNATATVVKAGSWLRLIRIL